MTEQNTMAYVAELYPPLLRTKRQKKYANGLNSLKALAEIREKEKNNPDLLYIFNDDILISDDEVPQEFKDIGGKINYNIVYNDKTKNSQPEKTGRTLGWRVPGIGQSPKIFVNIHVEVYENTPEHHKIKNANKSPNYVFSTVQHEIKHVLDDCYQNSRKLEPSAEAISPENTYRLEIERERAATIFENFKLIDKYFKSGEDFKYLLQLTPCIIKQVSLIREGTKERGESTDAFKRNLRNYLLNSSLISASVSKYWDDKFKNMYCNDDIKNSMQIFSNHYPTADFSNDGTIKEKEYNRQRSLILTFERFNPNKKKTELIDLSSVIPHVTIREEDNNAIIKPCYDIINKRKSLLSDQTVTEAKIENARRWNETKKYAFNYYNKDVIKIIKPKNKEALVLD